MPLAATALTLCRARYLLPLAGPDRARRIQDGYVLGLGESILEVGPYTADIGRRLMATWGDRLEILHTRRELPGPDPVPMQDMLLLPAFVKAHGHDHEQPLIGIAKDEPLTAWLDHAVNPFTGFLNARQAELTERLGCSPQLASYRMARVCDLHYGITAALVHHCNWNKFHLEAIAQANEAAGTTLIVAIGGQDRHYAAELLDRPGDALRRLERGLEIQAGCRSTWFVPGPDQCFSNSRAALVPQKALHQDATLLPSQQLLEMITVAPSRILRLNQGELAPGRQADWLLLDLDRPNLVPTRLDNLTENLMWATDGSEVDTVVARGRLVKHDGVVLPFRDGTRPRAVQAQIQALSEWYVQARHDAPELRGTGVHA